MYFLEFCLFFLPSEQLLHGFSFASVGLSG
jgi:hypothetical protein